MQVGHTLSRKRRHRHKIDVPTAILTFLFVLHIIIVIIPMCVIIQFITIDYLYTYCTYRSKRDEQIILRLLTNTERKEVNKNYIEYTRNGLPWFI